ncbi:MAG: prepilin-type N-terminal cleavage/methylation domain-containing protein [Opitutae bacterium]|nr:prepilin-type N-terminal cleavage/methylation domain-containing protein [Opitutae bacterium]
MNNPRLTRGFTLLELLVAVTITLLLAGVMLAVTIGTLNLWRRTQDDFTAAAQAKLALDLIERDLQAGVFRKDGVNTWLAADVIDTAAALDNHGWRTAARMKPATGESLRLVPETLNGLVPGIAAARFGLSGVWLRFITTNVESGGSLPVAVAYQLVRRPVSGSNTAASNPAEVRYSLFRSAVAVDTTLASGYDVTVLAYGSGSASPSATRTAATLTNPNTMDALATNVVDLGAWLYVRDPAGALRRIFPATDADLSHGARDDGTASDANRYPDVADVMVRILTEEGARRIEAMEQGSGALTRPADYATDAAWWWAVVEANSRVFVRRVERKGGSL